MRAIWNIELFGGLRVTRGERVWARFRTRRAAALIAYLALNAALRRDLDESPDAPLIDADRRTLRLVPGAFATDVARFESLARQDDPAARREAVELYRGPLLRDFHDEWTLGERERLALLCGALLRRVQADDEARGARDDARAAALRRVQIDPLGEEPHADLLRLLERPDALRRGRAFVETLARELGAQPSAAFLAQLAALEHDARIAPARAADPAAFDAAWAEGRAEPLERPLARAAEAL